MLRRRDDDEADGLAAGIGRLCRDRHLHRRAISLQATLIAPHGVDHAYASAIDMT